MIATFLFRMKAFKTINMVISSLSLLARLSFLFMLCVFHEPLSSAQAISLGVHQVYLKLVKPVTVGSSEVYLADALDHVKMNSGWLIIDPYDITCEIRQVQSVEINPGITVIATQQAFSYTHQVDATVVLTPIKVFQVELYGLLVGRGLSSDAHARNMEAIKSAVHDAGLAGGGVVMLPPGHIEFDTLIIKEYPDNVHIKGAGRDVTVLHPQENIPGGQLVIVGGKQNAASFLMEAAGGSDMRLRIHEVDGFAPNALIRIRDLSTVADGNGSWPYDPRTYLYNGEFLSIQKTDSKTKELHLVTPVQSSINYPVCKTRIIAPGARRGDTIIPVQSTEDYYPGTELVIFQNNNLSHIAKVTIAGINSLTIDTPLSADVNPGNSVMVHVQVSAMKMARGVQLENFSIHLKNSDSGGVAISYVDKFFIDHVAVYGAGWAGIWLSDCTNGSVSNFHIQGGDVHFKTNTGYGLQTYGCQWVDIHDGIVRGQRRTIDLSGIHPSRYVSVHDNILEGSVLVQRSTVAGTHGTAEYCDFTDNTIIGGQSGGLLIRGNAITIQGNRFYGTHSAAILWRDGAELNVIGNVLDGKKRWGVDSGGRHVDKFIWLISPRASQLICQGNIVKLEKQYLHVSSVVRDVNIWITDSIIFRTKNSPLINIEKGASARLLLDSKAINMGPIFIGEGQVLPSPNKVIYPLERNSE